MSESRGRLGWLLAALLLLGACQPARPAVTKPPASATAHLPAPSTTPRSIATVRPTRPPTATLLPLPTITPSPTLTLTPEGTPLPLTVLSVERLACTPAGDYLRCYDAVLQLSFEVPRGWGEIEATLRTGGYLGYAYQYDFPEPGPDLPGWVEIGGRSRDFSEGRGGMFTDFHGYDAPGVTSSNRCGLDDVGGRFAHCQPVSAQVVVLLAVPQASDYCPQPGPGGITQPLAFVEINLPENPTINGFTIVLPALSAVGEAQFAAALRDTLGEVVGGAPTNCDAATQQAFDARMAQLTTAILVGELDDETTRRWADVLHLAESVQETRE